MQTRKGTNTRFVPFFNYELRALLPRKQISLLRKSLAPLRKRFSPLRRRATPLRKPSSPLRRASVPLRKRIAPLRKAFAPPRKAFAPPRKRIPPPRKPSPPLRKRIAPLRKSTDARRNRSEPFYASSPGRSGFRKKKLRHPARPTVKNRRILSFGRHPLSLIYSDLFCISLKPETQSSKAFSTARRGSMTPQPWRSTS